MSVKQIKTVLQVEGMHCVACETRIEKKLSQIPGVQKVAAYYSTGRVVVTHSTADFDQDELTRAIKNLEYHVVSKNIAVGNQQDMPPTDYSLAAFVAVLLISIYFFMDRAGLLSVFTLFPTAKEGMGYGLLFLIGLLTSVHCIAMCGGICLSQSIPTRLNGKEATRKPSSLRPTISYNLGRVISYTVIGGIVGGIGGIFSLSGTLKGAIPIIAGIFMVIMGLNMLNLFPFLRRLQPRLPKSLARIVSAKQGGSRPLVIGLLNGLMPCGPLQAMQLYALSTGSPWKGAIAMFLFSIGTVPLMFSLGALSSVLTKRFTHKMLTVSAVLVILLGVFMFNTGASLSNITLSGILPGAGNIETGQQTEIVDGKQLVTTQLSSRGYEPIIVQQGIPVKWNLRADSKSLNGCNNAIVIPAYNIQKNLVPGDNIIEFLPTESGVVNFSCWMGMIRSTITVTEEVIK
jgi:sulfite exporter TauE/SafE/copper chaperone CopZ